MIAEKFGIGKTAMINTRAVISFALTGAMGDGFCGLSRANLIRLAEKLLEVPAALAQSALVEELTEETVTADRMGDMGCIFLTGLRPPSPFSWPMWQGAVRWFTRPSPPYPDCKRHRFRVTGLLTQAPRNLCDKSPRHDEDSLIRPRMNLRPNFRRSGRVPAPRQARS